MRKTGLDAIGGSVLDLSDLLERQEALGLELVFSVGVMAAGPVGTDLVGRVIHAELGLDLLQSAGRSSSRRAF